MRCPEIFCSTSSSSLDSSRFDTSSSSLDSSFRLGSRKRKSATPRRTSPLNDPSFRGVTVFMENNFIEGEWRLVIKQEYALPQRKKRKITYFDSSDEDEAPAPETPYTLPNSGEKHCASCNASKTPLWRDAEDGTPLCNACGIRYKKYKLRCGVCWHIPKKDEFSPRCRSCGSYYQFVSPRR